MSTILNNCLFSNKCHQLNMLKFMFDCIFISKQARHEPHLEKTHLLGQLKGTGCTVSQVLEILDKVIMQQTIRALVQTVQIDCADRLCR